MVSASCSNGSRKDSPMMPLSIPHTPPSCSKAAARVEVFSVMRDCMSACSRMSASACCKPALPCCASSNAGRAASSPNSSLATSRADSSPNFRVMMCSFSISATIASSPLNLPALSKNSNSTPEACKMSRASAFMPRLASASIFGPLDRRDTIAEKLVPNIEPSSPCRAAMP